MKDCLARQVLSAPVREGKQKPGGQKKIWMQQIAEDLQLGSWTETPSILWRKIETKTANRQSWRKFVYSATTIKGNPSRNA